MKRWPLLIVVGYLLSAIALLVIAANIAFMLFKSNLELNTLGMYTLIASAVIFSLSVWFFTLAHRKSKRCVFMYDVSVIESKDLRSVFVSRKTDTIACKVYFPSGCEYPGILILDGKNCISLRVVFNDVQMQISGEELEKLRFKI